VAASSALGNVPVLSSDDADDAYSAPTRVGAVAPALIMKMMSGQASVPDPSVETDGPRSDVREIVRDQEIPPPASPRVDGLRVPLPLTLTSPTDVRIEVRPEVPPAGARPPAFAPAFPISMTPPPVPPFAIASAEPMPAAPWTGAQIAVLAVSVLVLCAPLAVFLLR